MTSAPITGARASGSNPWAEAWSTVARENAPTPEQERHEVLLHLRVWEAVNPTPNARGELLH